MEHDIDTFECTEVGYVVKCTCGMRWTHPLSRSPEEMESIMQSHIAYYNKPKQETL